MNTSLFDRAAKYAIDAHANVYRKGKQIPYILHPMEAAMITSTMTENQEVLAAAVLHDVVEDTSVTVEDIRKEFGDRVARIVEHESILLHDEDSLSPDDLEKKKNCTWRSRKEQSIRRVEEGDMDSKMVAMGDKLSNLRAINRDYEKLGEKFWERFRTKDPKDHEWYYRSMGAALKDLADTAAYAEYMYLLHKTFDKMPPSQQMTLDEIIEDLK